MTTALVNEFRSWVKLHQKPGFNVHDEPADYVSLPSLKSYWTKVRVSRVLDSCNLHEDVEDIRERFLRVFSVLVHAACPRYINIFLRSDRGDIQFPSPRLPEELGPELDNISKEQWRFFPLLFSHTRIHKRTIYAGQILPVKYGRLLREERKSANAASVMEVFIDSECCQLVQEGYPVVFKIYRDDNAADLYTAEADVYCRLLGKADDSITKYYGSFSYDGGGGRPPMRVIMLEYAAKGNLLEYLKVTERPSTPGDMLKLWTQLLKLLDGLYVLHYLNESPNMKGVHQDIQPANILVFPLDSESRFDVQFKLTDFGLAELSRDLGPEGHMVINNGGSRMYSSPECYVNYDVQQNIKPHILPRTDIWSLGAVYSEILVWSLSGRLGVESYRKSRQDAIKSEFHMPARDFDACFHNGSTRLAVVDDFLQDVLENKASNDQVSPAIKDSILDDMLTDYASRLDAMVIKTRVDKRINAPPELHSSESSKQRRSRSGLRMVIADNVVQPVESSSQTREGERTPDSQYPPLSRPINTDMKEQFRQITPTVPQEEFFVGPLSNEYGTQASEEQHVSVDKVYNYLEKKSKSLSLGRIKDIFQGSQHDAIMRLPGIEHARRLINTLGGRDQIILIDNSDSMFQYRSRVAKTARVISYLIKGADTNGMDLYFTSDTTETSKCFTSRQVESKILKKDSFEGRCNMSRCLSSIMEPVYGNGLKETSVYIYTDGNWEDDKDASGVIKQAIARLIQAQKLPPTLMFQFIQFGHDRDGTYRLWYLDNKCVKEHELGTYDIVDTKHCKGNVPSIVIGSITKQNDDKTSLPQLQGQHSNTT